MPQEQGTADGTEPTGKNLQQGGRLQQLQFFWAILTGNRFTQNARWQHSRNKKQILALQH
jgi:hypothetical protein